MRERLLRFSTVLNQTVRMSVQVRLLADVPHLIDMVVRPGRRRQGIGRLLLERLESHAVHLGHPVVWVLTGGPAVGYYERCGWQRAEELPSGTLLRKRPAGVRAS
jgi:GNAT superfamily N-acetyltransferase